MSNSIPLAAEGTRRRTSVPLLLGFLASLLTLAFAGGVAIPLTVAGSSWQSTVLNAPVEFHELREVFDDVAPYSPEAARAGASAVRAVLFAPLALPLFLSLLALPGVLGGRRRGMGLFVAVVVLLGIQTMILVSTTKPVADTVERYCDEFEDANDTPEALLISAEQAEEPIGRLARLHRAAGTSGVASDSPDAAAPLVRMALDVRLSPQERKIALLVLERLYSHSLADPRALPSCPDWRSRFAKVARPGSGATDELRAGFIEILSLVPDVRTLDRRARGGAERRERPARAPRGAALPPRRRAEPAGDPPRRGAPRELRVPLERTQSVLRPAGPPRPRGGGPRGRRRAPRGASGSARRAPRPICGPPSLPPRRR
jgi:hypothetical protein